jgi:hypothetical protein
MSIKAKPEIWDQVKAVVGRDHFDTWYRELSRRIPSESESIYSRKGQAGVYIMPLGNRDLRAHDLRLLGIKDSAQQSTDWIIEEVIPARDNKLRGLGEFEKTFLQVIGPKSID